MLLEIGLLRAQCHRVGIRDVFITGNQARLGPLRLRASETMRLRRLARDASGAGGDAGPAVGLVQTKLGWH